MLDPAFFYRCDQQRSAFEELLSMLLNKAGRWSTNDDDQVWWMRDKTARRYSTNAPSELPSLERALTKEYSMMSSGHGDCLFSSERSCVAYSFQGLKSR